MLGAVSRRRVTFNGAEDSCGYWCFDVEGNQEVM
jgi:hypothetical protein